MPHCLLLRMEQKFFHSYTPWLMEVNMKKSLTFKSLFALLFVAIAVFGFVGCNQPKTMPTDGVLPDEIVSYTPAECVQFIKDNSAFVFDQDYTNNDYGSTTNFQISSSGVLTIKGSYNDDQGLLISAFRPFGYDGILLMLKMDKHSNYGHYMYPNYNEEQPHNCFTAVYIKDISDHSVSYAGAVWHTENEPEGYTACADSFARVKELFINYGYEDTCDAYCTVCTR